MNGECSKIIKKVIEYKNKFFYNCTNILPRSRHCSQENFKFVVVGGKSNRQVLSDAFTMDGSDFLNVNSLPKINYGRFEFKTVCIKGEIYLFVGIDDKYKPVVSVEIHLILTIGKL